MTGYGDAECTREGLSYALEIRSVNNRYFKMVIKLPEMLQSFEPEVDKLLRSRLGRGSINYQLRIRSAEGSSVAAINMASLRGYVSKLQELVQEGLVETIDVAALLALPGVCAHPEPDEQMREQLWEVVQDISHQAVDKLIAMRREEGLALANDLLGNTRQIRELADATVQRSPQVVVEYQDRLKSRVSQLLADAQLSVDSDDLLREIAIFAERCDISEEIIRLKSHLDQFEQLCQAEEHTGRKLDFLAQEMLREVNTIGSKANDALIARHVVDMKGLIDRLKEQVQNVE